MKAQHTPGALRLDAVSPGKPKLQVVIDDGRHAGFLFAECFTEANAARVKFCCDHHDELVEALRVSLLALESISHLYSQRSWSCMTEQSEALKQARAALKKAGLE